MTEQVATLIQLGELLTSAGKLRQSDLKDSLARAAERGLPLGTMLLMTGHVSQAELRGALEAQSLVNDRMLDLDIAVKALKVVFSEEDTTIDEALRKLGWTRKDLKPTNRLGELLIEAEMLTIAQLEDCLKTSNATGMPLGKVLIFRRTLSHSLLLAVLSAQRLIREGAVTRDQAMKGLISVRKRKISLEESLAEFYKPPAKRKTPLGFILVEARIIKEASLMMCVELSMAENKELSEILIEQGFASKVLLDSSVEAQRMLDEGTITKDMASLALRNMQQTGSPIVREISESGIPRLNQRNRQIMHELLVLSGNLTAKDLARLDKMRYGHFDDLEEKLLDRTPLPKEIIWAVARALYLIDKDYLTMEDAVMALHHCRTKKVTLDEALRALGWNKPTHRKI